jgi:hypothetical protein
MPRDGSSLFVQLGIDAEQHHVLCSGFDIHGKLAVVHKKTAIQGECEEDDRDVKIESSVTTMMLSRSLSSSQERGACRSVIPLFFQCLHDNESWVG